MVSCALWEFEEALGWVILNNALAPLVHYSESHTLVPLQILHNAQLTILYCPNVIIFTLMCVCVGGGGVDILFETLFDIAKTNVILFRLVVC